MQYEYAIVIEKGAKQYWASVPDLPGCVSVGKTIEELRKNIREAIEFHLDGMVEDGLPIPKPTAILGSVVVDRPKTQRTTKRAAAHRTAH